MSNLAALAQRARPYRGALAGSAVLMLAEAVAALFVPWLAGRAAVAVLEEGGLSATLPLLTLIIGVFALQAALKFGSTFVLDGVSERIAADLRIALYDHLQALPLAFYDRSRLGDTLSLLTTDVYVVSGYVTGTLTALVPLAVTAAGAAAMMMAILPTAGLAALVLMPLFFLAMKWAGRRMRPIAVQVQHEEARAFAIAQENLGLLPAVKAFTREAQESTRYRAQIDQVLHLSAKQRRLYAALGPALQFLAAAGIVVVLAYAGTDAAAGRLSAAQLVSFVLYAQLLARPVAGIADLYGQTQRAAGALLRLRQAMDEPSEPGSGVGRPMDHVRGDIEFRGVGFSYDGKRPVLHDVDLQVRAGETVAIVGENGSGKSTLGHLLTRLHEPSTGSITLDGVDIRELALGDLRRHVGVVPQHVLLFNASVRDNIAYGRPEPDDAAIEAAARAARAHDFILALPQGYATVVGDRGVRLSGGEQQRIALARALLKDPPILVLDEATAMFDSRGEAEFLAAFREMPRRRTVLLITHRPGPLALADRTVRLEAGRLVETTA